MLPPGARWLLLAAQLVLSEGEGALSWRWPTGEPLRWAATTELSLPRGYTCIAPSGDQVTVVSLRWALRARCEVRAARRGVEQRCMLERVSLEGEAVPGQEARLDGVLAGLSEALSGQQIVLHQRQSGAVTGLELATGLRQRARTADSEEILRQMLRRIFSPLDLPLPGGPPPEVWRQRGLPLLFNIAGAAYELQGMRIRHGLEGLADGVVEISTAGDATVAGMDVVGLGRAHFDLRRGLLLDRWLLTDASLSAEGAGLGDPRYQTQRSEITLVEATDP